MRTLPDHSWNAFSFAGDDQKVGARLEGTLTLLPRSRPERKWRPPGEYSRLLIFLCLLARICFAQDSTPDVIRAVKDGNSPEVLRIIETGASLDVIDSVGRTPLMWAANLGNVEMVKLLLSKGADANAADPAGWTPLIHAAGAGHAEAVFALLSGGAAPSVTAYNGTTALIAAVAHPEVVKTLLESGADPHAQAKDGTTALAAAKKIGNADAVRLMEAALSPLSPGAAQDQTPPSAQPESAAQTAEAQPGAGVSSLPAESQLESAAAPVVAVEAGENVASLSASAPAQPAETSNATPVQPAAPNAITLSAEDQETIALIVADEPRFTSPGLESPATAANNPPVDAPEAIYVQLGSLSTHEDAEQLTAKIRARSYSTVIHERDGQFLLLAGPFPDLYLAASYSARLAKDGFESFIARLPQIAAATAQDEPKSVAIKELGSPTARQKRRSGQASNARQVFLQLGAFLTETSAMTFANELTDLEYQPIVQYADDGWFRVVFGPFPSKDEALAYREKLSDRGRSSVLRIL